MKFCYDTTFTLLNNPKDLDPSTGNKMDLLGLFWKEKKLYVIAREIWECQRNIKRTKTGILKKYKATKAYRTDKV